ncbi:MAG: hypothetical protein GWN58_52910 [Anaerolineae bacterium]|nr:hypothetical protein [Anaerolineae bacterium]
MAEDFPRYSSDLLAQLSAEVEHPKFPSTLAGVSSMDEAALRRGIWLAAQRALVDALVAQWQMSNDGANLPELEDDDNIIDNPPSGDDLPGVLGSDGDLRPSPGRRVG